MWENSASTGSDGSGNVMYSDTTPSCVPYPTQRNNSTNQSSQYRALHPLLSSPSFPHPARVIWMSSVEASPAWYNGVEDWQIKTVPYSYQCSKYHIDIVLTHLDSLALAQAQQPARVIRHLVTHPGICSTNFNKDMNGSSLDIVKLIFFYIVRIHMW
jgi:3-keto steroid reductase